MTFFSLICGGIVFYKLMDHFTDRTIGLGWLLILCAVVFSLLFMNLMNTKGWDFSSLNMSATPGLIIGLFILFYVVTLFFVGLSGIQEKKDLNLDFRVLFFIAIPMIAVFLTTVSLKLFTVAVPDTQIWDHGRVAYAYTNPADFRL